MSIPSSLRIAAIVVAVLTTAPASAHVEQAVQNTADSELVHSRDGRIINEVVVNGMVIGADAVPSMEPSRDPDSSWPN